MEKSESPYTTVVEMHNATWCNCFGEQFTAPQTHSFIIWLNNSTLMGLPKRTENMFTQKLAHRCSYQCYA